jgi:hypothetical protein
MDMKSIIDRKYQCVDQVTHSTVDLSVDDEKILKELEESIEFSLQGWFRSKLPFIRFRVEWKSRLLCKLLGKSHLPSIALGRVCRKYQPHMRYALQSKFVGVIWIDDRLPED